MPSSGDVQPVPMEDLVQKAMLLGGTALAHTRHVLPAATLILVAFGLFFVLVVPRSWNPQFRWIGFTAIFSAGFFYTFIIAAIPLLVYFLNTRGVTQAPMP